MLGVCYYPEHWPEAEWKDNARRMAEMGLSTVRIGEFAWSRIEPKDNATGTPAYDWGWLDRAIDVLGAAGLKVVLGTPTATPPKWLCDKYPGILPVDKEGRVRGFGSRRHYDFSSPDYRRESARIVTAMAERYGSNPHVAYWQIDNEFGCHDTIRSYSPAALARFRQWLARRYEGSIEKLNAAWGNVFWSMEFNGFDEVSLPNLTVTESGPSHRLDYFRFASDEAADYCRLQVEILRRHTKADITHNYMGFTWTFDHFDMHNEGGLDFASWDSYPLGFTREQPFEPEEKIDYAYTGHPDIAAFHHDLYRAVGKGRFWVMEQQPGPVNWADHNTVPLPGMVRLWTWQALSHGAEVVSYFRWKQAYFAQEQYHAGLTRVDNERDVGGEEAATVAGELKQLALPPVQKAPVALVIDYSSQWMTTIQPQSATFNYSMLAFRWYEAARRLGLDIDIVPPGADLAGYKLVLVPTLIAPTAAALKALASSGAATLIGPRAGSKTIDYQIPRTLAPGEMAAITGHKVLRSDAMPPGIVKPVKGGNLKGEVTCWRDLSEVAPGTEVLASFEDGWPAVLKRGKVVTLTGKADGGLIGTLIRQMAEEAGVTVTELEGDLRLRRRGDIVFCINSSEKPARAPAPEGTSFLLGGREVPPAGVSAWRQP